MIGVLLFSLGLFGDDTTSIRTDDYQKLAQKLDSLNANIEKLIIEREMNCNKEKAKIIITKKGWGIGMDLSVLRPKLEIGYTFKSRHNFRFGTYFGGYYNLTVKMFQRFDEIEHYLFLKESIGTPVFFGFMSLSTNMSALILTDNVISWYNYYSDSLSIYETLTELERFGFSVGFNLEFWLTSKACLTVGLDIPTYFFSDNDNNKRRPYFYFRGAKFGLRIQF